MTAPSLDLIHARLATVVHPSFEQPLAELGLLQHLELTDSALSLHAVIHAGSETLKDELRRRIVAALDGLSLDRIDLHFDLKVPARAMGQDDPIPGVKNVLLVMSGKGGVGKSTVAANLALALKRAGTRVGLLDADIYGPSVPTMFGVSGHPHSEDGKSIEPMQRFGLKLMSIGFMLETRRSSRCGRSPCRSAPCSGPAAC
jgi:ATP-binding protein involved in chromosome partitioning